MAKTVSAVIKLVDQFSAPSKEVARQSKNIEKRFKAMGDVVGDVGEIFSSVGETMMKSVTVPLTAIAGAGVKTVSEFQDAFANLDASTNLSGDALKKWQGTAENIYKNNYGESIADVSDSLATLNQLIPVSENWDDAAIQEVTESALALKDTFGYEVPESMRAARTLMDQFGIDATKAIDMIAAGKQDGLDFSGEWLDSINEYSVQFEKLGFTADDMFAIFKKGADSGAFNLDKIGDAIKEFSIRAIDGSDTTIAGFEKIGLNAEEMAQKFAAGGDTAKEAFGQVISGLAGMEDPLAQSSAGVDLFGTMWEDLGPDAVTALNDIDGAAVDVSGTIDELKNAKVDTLSNSFSELGRKIETDVLAPIGEQLIPYVDRAIDAVDRLVDWWNSLGESGQQTAVKIGMFAATIGPLALGIGKIASVAQGAITNMGGWAGAITRLQGTFGKFIGFLGGPVGIAIGIIAAAAIGIYRNWDTIAPVFERIKEAAVNFYNTAKPLIDVFGEAIQELGAVIMPILDDAFVVVFNVIGEVIATFIEVLTDAIDFIMLTFNGVIDFLTGVFSGDWAKVFEGLAEIVVGVVDTIVATVKGMVNLIIGAINGLIKGLNKINVKVPEVLQPLVGGKTEFGFDIPLIPKLYKGTDNWKGGIAEISEPQYGGEIVDLPKGTRVYPHDESIAMARAEGSKTIALTIAKLADSIVVREDADIERIADALAKKLLATAQNQAIGVA